ncbi:MAG: ABC transporter permease, partial [bacterium]
FAFLGVLLACLGLFGLSFFTTAQRTKEIGVRKVLGASVGGILSLLSKDYSKLVLLAALLATPLTYFALSRWLAEYAYRIEVNWPMFVMPGLVVLAIALLTVSYQTIKAALANPMEALRYE